MLGHGLGSERFEGAFQQTHEPGRQTTAAPKYGEQRARFGKATPLTHRDAELARSGDQFFTIERKTRFLFGSVEDLGG